MERSHRLLLVAGLLAVLLPAAAATFGPQPGAPCEPTLLATQVALFCASDAPTAPCCGPVVSAVDLGGGVPCLCRVAAEPQLVMAGLNATHLLTLYTSCGGLQDGARLAAVCEAGPAPPAAVVSTPAPPPPSPAPRRKQPAHVPPPPPASGDKPSSPPPQEHDGASHAKAVPTQWATSPLAGPVAPAAVLRTSTMSTAPPPASATRRKQPAGDAPSPLSLPQQSRAVAIFAIFGNIFSGGLYLAQAPTLWTIHKDGEVGANNVDIFLATLISSIVWLMYGLADPFTRAVVIINALGIGFEVFGLVIFLFYSAPEGRVRLTIGMAMITVAASISAASVYTYAHDPRYVLGIIGDCTSIIMYGGPIRQLIAVWQAKDTRHMSVLVAVTSLLNGTCWTVYGRLQKDTFILVPSAVGMASGLAQLGMWAIVKFFYPPA